MSKWVQIDPCTYYNLPDMAGCYVVFLNERLTYIGQSRSIKKRFSSYNIRPGYGSRYLTPWGAVREITVKCRYMERLGDYAMREIRLIHRLQPPQNCVGGSKTRRSKALLDRSSFEDRYFKPVGEAVN